MADEQKVKILKEQGVKAWNEWRYQDEQVIADLSWANISNTSANRIMVPCSFDSGNPGDCWHRNERAWLAIFGLARRGFQVE